MEPRARHDVNATPPPNPDSALPAGAEQWWSAQVHAVLREIAGRHLRSEDRITLNPTDLVHEAYLRMVGLEMGFVDRSHFVRFTSTQMRRVLVDHARRKAADKRGQHAQRLTLQPDHADAGSADGLQIVELDLLLTALAKADPRKAKIAEFHYFGGLTQEETAEALEVSPATVVRELRFLRSWLPTQLKPVSQDAGGAR
jgi:RNA polymerase sigma factor (TIGR02999 family)